MEAFFLIEARSRKEKEGLKGIPCAVRKKKKKKKREKKKETSSFLQMFNHERGGKRRVQKAIVPLRG